MKNLLTVALAIAVCGAVAQAQMVEYENFESYPVDETIHMKGIDQTDLNPGVDIPRWYVQQNSSSLADPGGANVEEFGGNKVLHNQVNVPATDNAIIGLAMSMESVQIDDYGVIYLRYALEAEGGSMIATNDLEAGWDYDNLAGGAIDAIGWQGNLSNTGYTTMAAMAGLQTDDGFYARDGGVYYTDAAATMPNQEWIEFWILVDHPNDRTQYYHCVQGGTPIQLLDELGDVWWGMRNQDWDSNAVQNLKFFVSNWGLPENECHLFLDTIGVEQVASLAALEALDASTLNMVGPELLPSVFDAPPVCNPGDADGDLDVDLDDFVILKNNFGTATGADCSMGDFDGDGDVDLDDFVLLKNNFGTTY